MFWAEECDQKYCRCRWLSVCGIVFSYILCWGDSNLTISCYLLRYSDTHELHCSLWGQTYYTVNSITNIKLTAFSPLFVLSCLFCWRLIDCMDINVSEGRHCAQLKWQWEKKKMLSNWQYEMWLAKIKAPDFLTTLSRPPLQYIQRFFVDVSYFQAPCKYCSI